MGFEWDEPATEIRLDDVKVEFNFLKFDRIKIDTVKDWKKRSGVGRRGWGENNSRFPSWLSSPASSRPLAKFNLSLVKMVLDSIAQSLDPYLVSFGFPHLSAHLPLVFKSLCFWLTLQLLSRLASPKIFPKTYPSLKPSTKTSWDVHFVAFCHASIIVPLVAKIWWDVRNKGGMQGSHPLAIDRTYGYDKQAGDVYAIALGYFIWDAAVSILVSSGGKTEREPRWEGSQEEADWGFNGWED